MEPVISVILTIGSISSAAMALLALISLVFKKPKEWIKKWISNLAKEEFDRQLQPINEKLNDLIEKSKTAEERERTKLGHSIMTIYDRSVARGYITLADKTDLIELYGAYKDVHGNHHIDDYKELMDEMEVK